MYNGLLIVLLVGLVALLVWRQNRSRSRAAREREERRARTDQVLARALRGDERQPRHTVGGGAWPEPPVVAAGDDAAISGRPTAIQAVDIDILLGDEPSTIAEQARQQLGKPTTLLSGLGGPTTVTKAPAASARRGKGSEVAKIAVRNAGPATGAGVMSLGWWKRFI